MPKHLTTEDELNFVTAEIIGAADGVASLGPDGKVPDAQLPPALTGSVDSVNGQIGNVTLDAGDVGAIPLAALGANNGVASLDSTGHIPASQVPGAFVQTTSLGVANGVATLGSDGKLTSAQTPTAPVTSVAGRTGAVTLTATDVSAIPTSQKGAASGVATLDSGTKIPIAQVPSLLSLYQPVPNTTPTKPGQMLTAVAGGSNSTQWTEPLLYTASSLAAMPAGVPAGSLCVRTDLKALYEYSGSAWSSIVPNDPGWSTLTLPSGSRGYNANQDSYLPRYKLVGSQVWLKGRVELTSGSDFTSGFTITLPSAIVPPTQLDLMGAATTSGSQTGVCRWQINPDGSMVFFAGTSPTNPATTWLGLVGTYLIN